MTLLKELIGLFKVDPYYYNKKKEHNHEILYYNNVYSAFALFLFPS